MILTDFEKTQLRNQLNKLKGFYMSNDEKKNLDNIEFLNSMITKIDNDIENINKVIYNKIGNNIALSKIYAGGHLCYYFNKYHEPVTDILLQNHIGEQFEIQTIDLTTDKIETTVKLLVSVQLDSDGNIKRAVFE